jgi:hypothetical protein
MEGFPDDKWASVITNLGPPQDVTECSMLITPISTNIKNTNNFCLFINLQRQGTLVIRALNVTKVGRQV